MQDNPMTQGDYEDEKPSVVESKAPFSKQVLYDLLYTQGHFDDAYGANGVPQGKFASWRDAYDDHTLNVMTHLGLLVELEGNPDEAKIAAHHQMLGKLIADTMINYVKGIHERN